jgi:hypothetical protein
MARVLVPGRSWALRDHTISAILAATRSDSAVEEVSHDLSSQHPFPPEYSMLNLGQKLGLRTNPYINRSHSSQSESLSQIPSLSQLRDLNQSPLLLQSFDGGIVVFNPRSSFTRMNSVPESPIPSTFIARFPEADIQVEQSFENSTSWAKVPPQMTISEAVLEEQSSNEESVESQSQIKNYLKRRASKNQAAAAYMQPPED